MLRCVCYGSSECVVLFVTRTVLGFAPRHGRGGAKPVTRERTALPETESLLISSPLWQVDTIVAKDVPPRALVGILEGAGLEP